MDDDAAAAGGYKAYVVAISIQVIYAGFLIVSKAAFDHGINPFVFVFYRQAAASLLLLPIALLRHRKDYATSMPSPMLLFKLFICTLTITFHLNLYGVSLKFTSATVASAADNSVPAVTFFLSLLLRMEHVKLKRLSGVAKLAGMALCLAGVLVIALYVGPSINPVNHHHAFASHASSGAAGVVTRSAWVKWTFLMLLANTAWSLWIVLQGMLLKEYPNKVILTVLQCVFTTVQSFVVAVVAERDFSKWILRLDISLLAVLYNGFVVTGVSYYLQAWCVEMKGPVFFAIWTPLCFILTIFSSSFFLGEIVHLGSIVGAILLVCGLYGVLWGKNKEETKVATCAKVNSVVDE